MYTALLTLEDATGELEGRLVGADGARFFQGMPPVNLQVNTVLCEVPIFTRRLIGSPINFADCLTGSPISLQSRVHREHSF